MTSPKILRDRLREVYVQRAIAAFAGEEILRTGTGKFAIPCLDEEQGEQFVVITVQVPTGSREDGEGYDGYSEAQEFATHTAEVTAKRAEAKAKADIKKEKDKARREAASAARAEHKKGE